MGKALLHITLDTTQAFAGTVNEFWFADKIYALLASCQGQKSVLDGLLNSRYPRNGTGRLETLKGQLGLQLVGCRDVSPQGFKGRSDPPRVLQETYRTPWGEISIYWWGGDAVDAFRYLKGRTPLSVFFYRGDSPGEGGSGIYWLSGRLFPEVLDALVYRGFIVSDGSNARRKFRKKKEEWRWCPANDPQKRCWSFRPVGELDPHYGPTRVWQVEVKGPGSPIPRFGGGPGPAFK